MDSTKCQIQDKDKIHEGRTKPVLLSFRTRLIMTLASPLSPLHKRLITKSLKRLTIRRTRKDQPTKAQTKPGLNIVERSLEKGDMVRVRLADEIRATLNSRDRLKGCKFMPEMEQYCGTLQRVFKPVERFVNERDYTVRKASGLVLLENLFCEGFAGVGRCDRSCFYFWRVEWLEFLGKGE